MKIIYLAHLHRKRGFAKYVHLNPKAGYTHRSQLAQSANSHCSLLAQAGYTHRSQIAKTATSHRSQLA